jgi:hypothetical protein
MFYIIGKFTLFDLTWLKNQKKRLNTDILVPYSGTSSYLNLLLNQRILLMPL